MNQDAKSAFQRLITITHEEIDGWESERLGHFKQIQNLELKIAQANRQLHGFARILELPEGERIAEWQARQIVADAVAGQASAGAPPAPQGTQTPVDGPVPDDAPLRVKEPFAALIELRNMANRGGVK